MSRNPSKITSSSAASGRIGSIIAREFSRRNVPFVIIEREAPARAGTRSSTAFTMEADASAGTSSGKPASNGHVD